MVDIEKEATAWIRVILASHIISGTLIDVEEKLRHDATWRIMVKEAIADLLKLINNRSPKLGQEPNRDSKITNILKSKEYLDKLFATLKNKEA